ASPSPVPGLVLAPPSPFSHFLRITPGFTSTFSLSRTNISFSPSLLEVLEHDRVLVVVALVFAFALSIIPGWKEADPQTATNSTFNALTSAGFDRPASEVFVEPVPDTDPRINSPSAFNDAPFVVFL